MIEIKRIVKKIKTAKTFLITAHVNLEGDAIGSELATYILLRKLGKKVTIYNHDSTPAIYKYLPFSRVIKNDLAKERFDVAMVLDCSDSSRAGKVKDSLVRADCITNIDHHISNTYFADLNWVEPATNSTAQMIYKLCRRFKVMDKNLALCLYTGIFTDTGSFTYASTNSETHKVVSELMKYNIQPDRIYQKLHSLCNLSDLNFIGGIISSLKIDSQRKICWAVIKDWKDMGYDLTEVVFSIMRRLKDFDALILFKKIDKNRTRVNFRSNSYLDVNRIAKFFGGGGHKRASGTTIEERIESTEKKVISFVKRYTNSSKAKK